MITIEVPVHLVRQLLKRDEAHENLLAAYRAGARRTPGKAIDALGATRDAPDDLRQLLAQAAGPQED